MCNCKQANGFQDKLKKAQAKSAETGKTYVVFTVKGYAFMATEEDAKTGLLGNCCYFLPDGTEVELPEKEQELAEEIADNDYHIEADDEEETVHEM